MHYGRCRVSQIIRLFSLYESFIHSLFDITCCSITPGHHRRSSATCPPLCPSSEYGGAASLGACVSVDLLPCPGFPEPCPSPASDAGPAYGSGDPGTFLRSERGETSGRERESRSPAPPAPMLLEVERIPGRLNAAAEIVRGPPAERTDGEAADPVRIGCEAGISDRVA